MADFDNDQEKKPVWGFKWDRVLYGIACLLAGGLWLVGSIWWMGGVVVGRIFFLGVGVCVAGLFLVLDGLMGEEGIW